jgi:HK97 gp10 family phage protein
VSNDNKNYKSNISKTKYVLTDLERAALKEIGIFVAGEARKNAPIGIYRDMNGNVLLSRRIKTSKGKVNHRAGTLKRNIGYSIRRKEKSVQIGVRGKAFYGLFVEKGHKVVTRDMTAKGFYINKRGQIAQKGVLKLTQPEGKKKKWRNVSAVEFGGRNVPAQPFLTPAAERNIPEITRIAAKYLKQIEQENIDKKNLELGLKNADTFEEAGD